MRASDPNRAVVPSALLDDLRQLIEQGRVRAVAAVFPHIENVVPLVRQYWRTSLVGIKG